MAQQYRPRPKSRPTNNSRSRRGSYQRKPFDDGPRRNHMIRAKSVFLIDENSQPIGEVSINEALKRAAAADLDLVEVGAKATPPVCKIIDYAKYQYEQKKKQRKNKQKSKQKDLKEFRFSPVIGTGDMERKIKRAKEYLAKGHNVRLFLQRKGRQSQDLAKAKFEEIMAEFEDYDSIEGKPKFAGRRIAITYKPQK